jgi:hypothetical protein
MKVRTIVGILLSSLYLILVTWLVFSAFDCPVVTYCLGLVVFYYGLPWTFLLISLFNLLVKMKFQVEDEGDAFAIAQDIAQLEGTELMHRSKNN